MPTNSASDSERDEWLYGQAEGRRQFTIEAIPKSHNTVYLVNGKRTNVKYSQVVGKRARFALGNTFLKKQDVFVFICESHEHFYAINRAEMNWLANRTTRDSSYGLPEFNINVKTDEYYSGHRVFPIGQYRDNWEIFRR
jgi:hypothetical protein